MKVSLYFSGTDSTISFVDFFDSFNSCIKFIIDTTKEFDFSDSNFCVYGCVDCSVFEVEDFLSDRPVVVF